MSYISINNEENNEKDNKNAPISSVHTAAVTGDDVTRQNLEKAFRNASTEDDSNGIATTSPQTTKKDNDDDDSDKENTRPSSHSSASSIDSEKRRQSEATDDVDQQLVNAKNTIKLLNARLTRLRAEHKFHIDQLIAEHELELQSIGRLQINTCRINTDTELCKQELLKLQTRFATQFVPPAFESEPTNCLLSRFHKIQAALADLRAKIPALNSIAEQQNLSLLSIRQEAQTHTAHALQILQTYTNLWHQTTKPHEDALGTQIPILVNQERLLLKNIDELTKLLKQVPGNAGSIVPYMPCGPLEILQLNSNKLTKQFLTYAQHTAISSVFFLLYITSHATSSSAPLERDANAHTVHLMEVWTQNPADAYVIAPMILRTGTYNNVLRVRWYWNKHCIGQHIILYVSTDDSTYFHENATKRPELEWLEASLGTYMEKVYMLLYHSYPDATNELNNDLQQNSQNVIDIDLRPFTYSSGGIRNDNDDSTEDDRKPPPRTDSWHVSDNYVVRNEEGNINQKQSILAIANANGLKCDVLKALCDKTHHWAPCMSYNIFCKNKNQFVTSFDKNSCRNIASACNLSRNTGQATHFCKLKKLFCQPPQDD
eukprot:gene17878-19660_t